MIAEPDPQHVVVGAVLAAAELDVEAGWRIVDRLLAVGRTPETFTDRALGEVWALMIEMRREELPLDCAAVAGAIENVARERLGGLLDLAGDGLLVPGERVRGREALRVEAECAGCFSRLERLAADMSPMEVARAA